MKKGTIKNKSAINFAFFGTPDISIEVLDELASHGLIPSLIITAPDRPTGRGMQITPPPVKVWAQAHNIEILQPEKIDQNFILRLSLGIWDVFVVVAYGKILPKALLEIPKYGTLNVHPSLLPRWRGPSPVRAGILAGDKGYGVTVMLLDEKMDHGPILAQKVFEVTELPPHASTLEHALMHAGGALLSEALPNFCQGRIIPVPQNHEAATFCKKITKEDGLLDLSAGAEENLRKIRAYEEWPGTYAFFIKDNKNIRVKIIDAHIDNGKLVIDNIVPEGKRAMPYSEFIKTCAIAAL